MLAELVGDKTCGGIACCRQDTRDAMREALCLIPGIFLCQVHSFAPSSSSPLCRVLPATHPAQAYQDGWWDLPSGHIPGASSSPAPAQVASGDRW